eukprot:TRINITY_DN3835_c0_g3_i1.p1 TRINITY_DN3835_c0_g3~~TRINITY_DN3835_c0_g3_i1.p1  ORF type:complete len:227 (-),score=31.77 TRINITY_DN3835_c0_g3_i1:249-929(-)
MHAYYSPNHVTHVGGHTYSASGGNEFSVHRERNVQSATSVAGASGVASIAEFIQEGMTTLMLTDLPYSLTLADLKDELELLRFGNSYDYIFYPKERKQHFRGYCFINFVSTAEAKRFAYVFVDHKFELFPSPKLSNVQVSRSQGLLENLAKIKPGATRFDNFFIDWERLRLARGGNTVEDIRGWYGGHASASWSSPGGEAYEPHDVRFDEQREYTSSQIAHHGWYQ